MTSVNDVVTGLRTVIGESNVVSGLKGHSLRLGLRIGENRRICPFPVCCGNYLGKITYNAINGSLLDTLVPK